MNETKVKRHVVRAPIRVMVELDMWICNVYVRRYARDRIFHMMDELPMGEQLPTLVSHSVPKGV